VWTEWKCFVCLLSYQLFSGTNPSENEKLIIPSSDRINAFLFSPSFPHTGGVCKGTKQLKQMQHERRDSWKIDHIACNYGYGDIPMWTEMMWRLLQTKQFWCSQEWKSWTQSYICIQSVIVWIQQWVNWATSSSQLSLAMAFSSSCFFYWQQWCSQSV
jgi:hypothetical protein